MASFTEDPSSLAFPAPGWWPSRNRELLQRIMQLTLGGRGEAACEAAARDV